MKNNGILVVLSGFSGAGKGTIMKKLLEDYGSDYALSISATTRSPREGEKEGISYFFVSRERFEEMIDRGELLEYAEYVGNYYGTPRAYVEQQMRKGRSVILEIELQGALQIKKIFPETRLIFVTPPSADILLQRLTDRGTETPEVIRGRMARAAEESKSIDEYEYLIVNDKLEDAVRQLHEVISAECRGDGDSVQKYLVAQNRTLIEHIKEGL